MIHDLVSIEKKLQYALFFSTIFGFGLGTCYFCLQQVVLAQTVQVQNIGYKLITMMISRFMFPDKVPVLAWVGFFISVIGIQLYSFAPKSSPKRVGSRQVGFETTGGGSRQMGQEVRDKLVSEGGSVQAGLAQSLRLMDKHNYQNRYFLLSNTRQCSNESENDTNSKRIVNEQ